MHVALLDFGFWVSSYDNFSLIQKECVKRKIDFISTPYSFEDVDFLMKLNGFSNRMKLAH